MYKNKKAEGTASSFLIASLIAITVLISLGTMINGFSTSYDQTEIEYFNNYDSVKGNFSDIGHSFVSDYDFSENSTKPDVDRTEDLLFWRVYKAIKKFPGMTKDVTKAIYQAGSDLQIPIQYLALITLVLSILLIVLVFKVIRGFNNV